MWTLLGNLKAGPQTVPAQDGDAARSTHPDGMLMVDPSVPVAIGTMLAFQPADESVTPVQSIPSDGFVPITIPPAVGRVQSVRLPAGLSAQDPDPPPGGKLKLMVGSCGRPGMVALFRTTE